MREIKIQEWAVKNQDGTEGKENLLMLLSLLVTNQDPTTLPKGYEQFRLFTKLTKTFEKAAETKILVLEEDTYKFLKNNVEKNIPAIWGTNKNIVEALTLFMDAVEE